MRKLLIGIASIGLISGSVVGASPASAGSLDLQGATLSWDDATFYAPDGCSRFKFNWTNNSGRDLLRLAMTVTSRFGDSIARDSKIGIDPGTGGIFDVQICRLSLTDGLGPYNVNLYIGDYTSRGGGSWEVTAPLTFISRTPAPEPAPATATAPAPATTTTAKKSVKCISKKTFKKKTYQGKTKCPKGWVKI